MELKDAVKIVKAGNLKSRGLFELWEVEQVLAEAGDTENLAAFRKEFSEKDMKTADAAAKVEVAKRQTELDAVKAAYTEDEAFKKGMDNFWNGIEIANDKGDDKVEAGELRRQIEEVSAHEAEKEILEGKAKPEDYKKLLQNIMSANCVQLVAVSAVSEMVAKGKKLTGAAAKTKATAIFTSLFSAERKEKVQISGKAAIGFLASKTNSLSKFAKRLADHTGLTAFAKKVKDTDKKLTKAYPKAYPFAKNLAKTGAIAVLFGGVGIAVYSTYRLGQTVSQQRMAAEKEEKSYWEYLKNNKEQMVVLAAGVVSSAISFTGMSMENMGLTSQLLNADAAKDVADASVATAASSGFSWSGAWEGIKNNFTNSRYLLRTGAATAASIAIASKEYSKLASMDPDSPEYKLQRNKAHKVLAGSALGTLIGLTTAAAIGGMHGAEAQTVSTETDTPAETVTTDTANAVKGQTVFYDWNNADKPGWHNPFMTHTAEQPDNYVELPKDMLHSGTDVNTETHTAVETHTAATYEFPDTYNPEMGITHAQYSLLQHLYKPEDLDRMYLNLSGEGVMNHFEGMTKEEVLFKYQRLDAYTDRVDANGNSIQGAVRYHYEEEMTAINKLLNCGDKLTDAQYAAINKALAVIDDRGGYHGPGYVPTTSVMIKADQWDNCGEGHMNHWKLGHRIEQTETRAVEQTETRVETREQTIPTEIWEDQTSTTYENLKYDASFQPTEYHAETETSHKLFYQTYGKDSIHVGDAGVRDMYVTRGGERVEISGPDDLQRGDKLVIQYEHGTETVPARKFAGFETTENTQQYTPYSEAQIAAEAKELGVEPNKLTKLENGDYIKVTSDGVVRIDADAATGKASVVLTDFDGKPMNAPAEVQNQVVNNTVNEMNETNADKEVVKTEKVRVASTVVEKSTTTGQQNIQSGTKTTFTSSVVRQQLISRGKI